MDGEIACKLALLKSILDDLDARITSLGLYEPRVAHAIAEMHVGVTQARLVVIEWQET